MNEESVASERAPTVEITAGSAFPAVLIWEWIVRKESFLQSANNVPVGKNDVPDYLAGWIDSSWSLRFAKVAESNVATASFPPRSYRIVISPAENVAACTLLTSSAT